VEQNNNLNPFFSVDVGSYANPALADLDGDNYQDVLIGNDLESVQYFRNESGTFTEVTGSDNPFNDMVLGKEPSPTIGDLDGDGDNDVLIGDELGKIKYFENNGGIFTEKTGSDNPLDGVNVGVDASPAMGDLDGDNDLDLLVGEFTGKIKYFKNEGGTFTEQIGNNNPFSQINVYSDASPTIVDFDGDGDDDVLVGNDWGELLYFQNNQGSFEQLKGDRLFEGINTGEETSPAMGDLDEDGDVDVLIGVVDGTLKYLENNPGDILTGTPASDTFVLGDLNSSFYANKGEEDYALIQNFDPSSDIIQLNGTVENYQLGVSPVGLEEGTAILLNSTELIGIVEGVSELNIEADYFSFI